MNNIIKNKQEKTKMIQNISNIPVKHKAFYLSQKDKRDFVNAMPEMIKNNAFERDAYFLTLTFRNIKRAAPYNAYLTFMYHFHHRLEQELVSRLYSKTLNKSPILIMFPENNPATHFHGILMTHKHTSERFLKKCCPEQISEYIPAIEKTKPSFKFSEKILNPYPKEATKEHLHYAYSTFYKQTRVKLNTYKLHPLDTDADFVKSSQYSAKSFTKHNFSYDDMILIKRPESSKMHKYSQEKSNTKANTYEKNDDVL